LVFAQVQTEEKSSKITAIPALLEQIAIAGCIVTIDVLVLDVSRICIHLLTAEFVEKLYVKAVLPTHTP